MENGSNANLTPAQKAGFQVGDSAIVIGETNGFSDGQRVTLYEDDGTIAPLWRGDNQEFKDICGPGVPGAYLLLYTEVRKPTEWDWTEWPGGSMPVDGDTLVDVRFRNGSISKGSSAGRFRWQHIPKGDDIVAYRISQTETETQNTPHAENRRLYAIDEAEFGADQAPKYWQLFMEEDGYWASFKSQGRPRWFEDHSYRRYPFAPAQPSVDWVNAPDWAYFRVQDEAGLQSWLPHYPHASWDYVERRPTEAWFNLMRGEPEAADADPDGWIAWHGVGMPVDGDTLVEVRLRGSHQILRDFAWAFAWGHDYDAGDIVAYRISQPEPETQSEPATDGNDDTLTGAALHRAIADAIDAGEGLEAFEHWAHIPGRWAKHGTFKELVAADSRGVKIRRKFTMRSATLPNGGVVEWPAPMTTEPSRGQFVYRANPGKRGSLRFRFDRDNSLHQRLFAARVLYADSESAEKHGIAVAKLNGGEVADEDR